MALVVKDRVKQTTTTTGTGSIVLNGTVDGFQTFAAALANGDTTYYSIFEVSTNAYEIGLGTWNESTSTLARTTVLESSNSGSAINLTAQAEVFITYPAEKSVFLDSNGDVTLGNDLVVTGDFTVNGTTTTVNTTNSVVSDALIELGNGTSGTPSNDAGIVIERGSSDNAFIGYDESADKFTVGTGSFTGASTGNLTISTGTLVANVEGNVTGNVTGNVSGSSGSTTGNAATATALQNARTIAGQSFDGTANITIAPTDLTGVSADAAEINILDGVTSTTAELNLLDGVTATTTELNYVDGVTSAIQTQLDAKASLSGATFTGTVTADGISLGSGGVFKSSIDTSNVALSGGTNSNVGANIVAYGSTHASAANDLMIRRSGTKFALFDGATGDISFYEDTGATAKLFWDASAESLVVGASSTATVFEATGSKNDQWAGKFTNTNSGGYGVLAITAGSTANEKAFEVRKNTSDTAMLIDGLGNVGIGTSSPSSYHANANNLVIQDSGNTGITIATTDSAYFSEINFADGTSGAQAYAGILRYAHSDNSLRISVNASEKMRVNSGGNVAVGGTSFNAYQDGSDQYEFNIYNNGQFAASVNNAIVGYINRQNGDGEILSIRKDGTTVGSIAAGQGDLVIGTGDTGVKFNDGLNSIYPYHTDISNGSQDNSIDIGYSTVRFKDLYLSGSLSNGTTSRTVADIVGTTSSQFLRSDANDTATGELTFNAKVDFADDVYIGWGGGSNRPSIQGNKSSGTLEFFVGGGERLQIDGTNSTFYTDIVAEDHDVYVGDFSGGNMGRLTYDSANGRGFTYQYDNAFVISNAQGSTEQYLVLGDSATTSSETLLGVSIYQSGIYYTRMQLTGAGDLILPNGSLREDWDSLGSSTTPTIGNAGAYSLTMSGNTTFTFPSPTSGYSTSFILQLTGNGGTVTYPASVDWAGGTAPDAPANGETDILVFWTRDGGTTWFGALSIDAAA